MPFDKPVPDFDFRADFWSLRFVEETCASYAVRRNIPLPFAAAADRGVMASVYVDGGYGYAATSDRSKAGLAAALKQARIGGVLLRQRPIGLDGGDPLDHGRPVDVAHEGVDVRGGVRAEIQVVRVLVHVQRQDRRSIHGRRR